MGGCITGALTHPTDTIKNNRIAQAGACTVDKSQKQRGVYGFKELWADRDACLASLMPNLVETTVFTFTFELAYRALCRAFLLRVGRSAVSIKEGLAIGMLSGALTQLTSCV